MSATRVNNKEDPVPVLPPIPFFEYHHVSGEIHIGDDGVWVYCPGKFIELFGYSGTNLMPVIRNVYQVRTTRATGAAPATLPSPTSMLLSTPDPSTEYLSECVELS